jgi:hypothetical protein
MDPSCGHHVFVVSRYGSGYIDLPMPIIMLVSEVVSSPLVSPLTLSLCQQVVSEPHLTLITSSTQPSPSAFIVTHRTTSEDDESG